jgi:hypothetical protein
MQRRSASFEAILWTIMLHYRGRRPVQRSRVRAPFKATAVDDFKVTVGEAIEEWRRYNLERDFVEARCTVLSEKTEFTGPIEDVADEVV